MSKILVEFEATVKDEVGAVNAMKRELNKKIKKVDQSGNNCPMFDDGSEDSFIDLLKLCLYGPGARGEIIIGDRNHYEFSSTIPVIGSFSINTIYETYFEILPYLEPDSKLNITVVDSDRHFS